MPYKLVIFDVDGTLTPQRSSSVGPTIKTLLPGVKDNLEALHADGIKVGIVSNQDSRRPAEEIKEHFDWIRGELGITKSLMLYDTRESRKKPSPYMLKVLMKRVGATPSETLFVGNAATDRQAAQNAQCDYQSHARFFK